MIHFISVFTIIQTACDDKADTATQESPIEDSAPPVPADCFFGESASFQSVEELECGLGPEDVVYCHWTIQFNEGEFIWAYSDVTQSGMYGCSGNLVTAESGTQSIVGSYEGGIFTWDDIPYEGAE